MEPDVFMPLILALIINLVILYFIIKGATASENRDALLKMQTKILLLMALQQSVNADALRKIVGSKVMDDLYSNWKEK